MSTISLALLFFILSLLKCIQELDDSIICERNAVGHSKIQSQCTENIIKHM